MLSTYSIGVHFSQTHAFIVCLDKSLSGITLKEYDKIDLSKSNTIEQRLENLGDYLSIFIDSKGLGEPGIYISFPAELSIVRKLTFPHSVKDDLASTIKYSLEKYIPLKADELYFDFSIISEDKEENIINVLLGAAKKIDLKPFIDLAGSMDAGVSGVQINTTAVANFIWYDAKQLIKVNPELFVFYADGQTLDIISFKNGIYNYSRQITITDNDDALLELIDNEVKNKRENNSSGIVETAVILCGTRITPAVVNHVSNDMEVSIKKHGFEKDILPSEEFIPAFGLALNDLDRKLALPTNLLPLNKRKKDSKTANYIMYSLIFIAIIFGVLWGVGFFMHQNMINKNIDAHSLRLEREMDEINLKKAEIIKLEKKIRTVNKLINEQVEVNKVLNELSKIIPSGSWVRSFVFKMDKGIKIMGDSDSASDLIPILESSLLFENCVFQSAITKTRDGKERFSIGCDTIIKGTAK